MNYSAYPYASPHRGYREKSFQTIFSHLQITTQRSNPLFQRRMRHDRFTGSMHWAIVLAVLASRSSLWAPSTSVNPLARPHNQSMTALGASDSLSPPTVGQPCDRPVPGDDEWTTA